MNRLSHIIVILFFVLISGFSPVLGQNHFRVIDGIPLIPQLDPASITSPETGMFIFSSADLKPMIYTGSGWETLCTENVSAITAQEYFVVKNGIPFLPTYASVPTGSLASGTIYYSTVEKSVMIYNGSSWLKMVNMLTGSIVDNAGFTAGVGVKTFKLPVLNANPSSAGLVAGAFYINSSTKVIRYYDGSAWQDISCQPVVKTIPVTSIAGYTAESGADVITNGGSPVTLTGICWSPNSDPDTLLTSKTRIVTSGSGIGTFASQMTGLLPLTTYHVRAYAVNTLGIVYGEDIVFTTPIAPPTIITLDATNIKPISVQTGGDITADGGSSVTKRGVIWSAISDPLTDASHIITNDGSGVGYYPTILDGLLGNTSYYVRAYAVNAAGTAYGNLVQFTTPAPVPPELNPTLTVDSITGSSVVGTALIMNNGGALVTERGVCYSTDQINYTYVPSTTVTPTDIGKFITKLTGLSQGTTYYLKGYAKNSAGIGYTSETSIMTPLYATITTVKPDNIAGSTATSGGIITNTGFSTITARGICWSTGKNPTIDSLRTSDPVIGDGTGTYASKLTGLLPGTTYYVRAYAVNSAGVGYGNLDSIVMPNYASVLTIAASSLFVNTATCGGDVLSDGGSDVTERGVCWSTGEYPTIANTRTSDGMGLGLFTSYLMALTPNVVYHFRAYAVNSIGAAYGADLTLTVIPDAPLIITLPITAITSMSGNSGGDIQSSGGAPITRRGIIWSTTGDPLTNPLTTITTNDGSGVGIFPTKMDNLLGNTTYYVRAYAVNSYGKAYGDLKIFKTLPPILAEVMPPTFSINDITNYTAIGEFLVKNNGGDPITDRGIRYTTDRINYTYVSSTTLNKTDIGTFRSNLAGLQSNTTYYAQAYAINSVGMALSSEASFRTTSLAVLTTTPPSEVTGFTATSGGDITFTGDDIISAKGICWSTDVNPTIDLATKTSEALSGIGTGTFVSRIKNLTPGVKYYVRAYAVNSFGVAYGNLDSLFTATTAFITTTHPTNVTNISAITGGYVNDDGDQEVYTRGVCWSMHPNPTTADSYIASGSGIGSFAVTLTDLMGSTKYYVRAYAINSVGTAYGNLDSLKTSAPILEAVSTTDVINIGGTTALGRGYVGKIGGAQVTERGFCWNTTGGASVDGPHAACGTSGNGSFAAGLTGLTPNTKYYARAYAANSVGVSYGDEITFSTFTIATIITTPASEITSTTAKSGGDIVSDGGALVYSSGICWNTTGNPTIYDANTNSGLGIGNFIHNLTGLMGSTKYYIRAYAINNAGTAYGNVEEFTTNPPIIPTLTTTTGVSGGSGTTGYCGGAIISNGGGVINTEGIVWSTTSGFLPDTVTVNKTAQPGSGSFNSTLTNLKKGTIYYVRAYATNIVGTGYASNEVSFTTFDLPVITTVAPSKVTNVNVTSGGNIASNGGTDIIESGLCWSTDILPTIDNEHYSDGSSYGLFMRTITELMGSTTYYLRAYARNSVGLVYGQVETFTTEPPVLATILTLQPVAATSVTAVSGGDILSHGGSLVTTRGIYWSTQAGFNPDTITVNKTAQTGYYKGGFAAGMTGLTPNTVYYVKAYVVNGVGTAYGDEMSFKTPTLPTLTTAYAYATGPTKAVSGGNITNDGGADISSRGVLWSRVPDFNPDTVTTRTYDGGGSGGFVSKLSELKGNTTYYIQAYASNIAGTAYGNILSFTTDPATLATLSTRDAWNVYGTSATSGGYVSDNGGEPILSRGMLWSTHPDFRPDTVVVNKVVQGTMGLGNFSTTMSNLSRGTTYYACAYAINSIGVAYGNVISFTTLDFPKLTTMPVSPSSTGYEASGGGTLVSDGGTPITNNGVCWSTSPNPTVGLYTKTTYDAWSGNNFYSSLTDLKPVTKYYVRAYASNNQGVAYGNEVTFTTPVALPIITTTYATQTSKSSVVTGGNITFDGGGAITQRGVIWSTDASFNPDTVVVNRTSDGIGSGKFNSVISNMQLSISYYIRAYAVNSAGVSYGNQVRVTLFPTAPILNTLELTQVKGSSAMSGGEITSDGGAEVTLKGLCWSTSTNPITSDSHTTNGFGTDSYTAMLSGLLPNTLYYVRAYAVNKIGTAYGIERTFQTNGVPTLTATTPVTNIIATTATSGGKITDDGRSPIITRGICWSTYSNPTIALTTKTVDNSSSAIGSFIANMKGLLPATTYYVRSYATNEVGTGYGSQVQFTTLAVTLPILTTIPPFNVDSVKATSGGDIFDNGGMPITAKGICWSTTPNPTISLATRITYPTAGDTTYTSTFAGLSPGTKYYVRAFAINSKGTGYGNLDSLTTQVIHATVSNVVISNITKVTANGAASVITDGGAPVTVRGLCWNLTGHPTIADDTLNVGSGIGNFTDTLKNLVEGKIYYVRAFATNSAGTAYSAVDASFQICPSAFTVLHYEGLNGAAVTKTVTYGSVSTSISGASKCWITQNLGADHQAASATDGTEPSAGWYWQFNRIQGYQFTSARYPLTWATTISESSDWVPANDPCNMLLGNGWRIPTYVEWTNADGAPQNWNNSANTYSSVLKLHGAGYLTNGAITSRGVTGEFWTATQTSAANGGNLGFNTTVCYMQNNVKSTYGFSLRCLRDSIVINKPSVSDVTIAGKSKTTVIATAAATPDGGAQVTARGFCWNTTGNPDINDHVVAVGDSVGIFTDSITGLSEGATYYIRAYATNSVGTAYSSTATQFKVCLPQFTVQHVAGLNGAPVDKTVAYHSVSATYSGAARCWITQNLGADHEATAVNDATEPSAGWYWQFNRLQGYKYAGSRTPSTTWTSNTESSDWVPGNDPCNRMLGGGWRIPTSTEYANVIANGGIPFSTPLKLHYSGNLSWDTGTIQNIGSYGIFWTSSATTATYATYLQFSSGANQNLASYKSHGFTLRCLKDTIVISTPSVSSVTFSAMTSTSAGVSAIVTPDGGSPVTERGFCWNTTGDPSISDNKIASGADVGNFSSTISGLVEGPTYYVKAYAKNSIGIAYGAVNSFKICPPVFTVQHIAGIDGAPVSKKVVYHSVSSTLSGKAACWLIQNLGADSIASANTDATEQAGGWYWQFNRIQGFKNDGTVRTPATSWIAINETSNWVAQNDPCTQLLGSGWRIPTNTEWVNVIANGNLATTMAYNSPLKMHMAGNLDNGSFINKRGVSYGLYWSSTQNAATTGYSMYFSTGGSVTYNLHSKSQYGFSIRCLRDTIVITPPSVGQVSVSVSSMTGTSADVSAAVGSDGGAPVSARGFCWNTTGNPTLSDNYVTDSSIGTGNFTGTITGLTEGPKYYVRAYATNSAGTTYGEGTGFSAILTTLCPDTFNIQHTIGYRGAPVTKTITYHATGSYLSGAAKCWITQNLGADHPATSAVDATEASAGWYFQFNHSLGYKNAGATTPIAWYGGFSESTNWTAINDPCTIMLGADWRIPTSTEWQNATGAPRNWTSQNDAYNTELKLHNAGYLAYNTSGLGGRGTQGNYWSSTQLATTTAYDLQFYNAASAVVSHDKAYGFSVRCLRDGIVKMPPTLSNVTLSSTAMTDSTAEASATILADGGAVVTERGICWNSTGNPTINDYKAINGSTDLTYLTTMTGLKEGMTYYVRAYAVNKIGLSYSPTTTSFKICKPVKAIHIAGLNGAPVSKTVTYGVVSTNITGKLMCWLAQNLGSDQQATSAADATEKSSGWYWQFNGTQGYKYDGGLTPSVTAWAPWSSVVENRDWRPENDPCNSLLGLGWRLPTYSEWVAVINNGRWASSNPYDSPLKIHRAGYLNGGGLEGAKGAVGYYCSSTQNGSGSDFEFLYSGSTGSMTSNGKSTYAWAVRCLRDTIVRTVPKISNATIVTGSMTLTTADASATVSSDGGSAVKERGFCWNTTGIPTISDNRVVDDSLGVGSFLKTLTGLKEGPTYYIRAYATNTNGTGYSPIVTSFKICPATFVVTHVAGLSGAPVSKTVTYHSVSSNLSGAARCWLTQNLGADQQPASISDATDQSSGWYWQFNSLKGYKNDGSTLIPAITVWAPWAVPVESHDWRPENDPCNQMLGLGWRLPTSTEWSNVINNGHWAYLNPFASALKIHRAGYLNGGGLEGAKGAVGYYCSSTQNGSGSDFEFLLSGTTGSMASNGKSTYAWAVRCLRDTLVLTTPSVTNAIISTSTMTLTTADATATVGSDGGSAVKARGFCWNTTGNPTIGDSIMLIGTGLGTFNGTIRNLKEGPTYYIRAFATNNNGTGYSPIVTSFKICPATFVVTHVAGLNGAPVSKTVTYHSVSSNLSGAARCWLIQNLGADSIASKINDATEQSSGWYWQFNSSQGYKNDGSTLTPSITVWTPWTGVADNSNWRPERDPCNLLLGLGWRLPTSTEWSNVINNGHWAYLNPYASPLMIHRAGYLDGGGLAGAKGSVGYYCSSTQNGSGSDFEFLLSGTTGSMTSNGKVRYAWSVRCLRDTLVLTTPSVTNAIISTSTMTLTTADAAATVASDGGSAVKARGFCWNTTGNPTIGDSIMLIGTGLGAFNGTVRNLKEGPTYYIRAFATNNNGTGYSPIVTSFKICPATFVVTHVGGLNGAPVSKTVTYHSVSSDLSGAARCWLTQNLGADRQPTAISDATELSSGWYWQFNSSQGYKNDGSTLTPSITAWTPWTGVADNSNWRPERDPCNLLLGLGWRLPTSTEWSNVINNGHWAYLNPYASPLMIHRAGYLDGGGLAGAKGSVGYYCSSTQNGSGSDFEFLLSGATGSMTSNGKVRYAWSVRCLRDTLVLVTPSVTNVIISTSTMTLTTADATATVGSDGGSSVKERGFCWNTTGNPTTADNVIPVGSGLGSFNETVKSLKEGPTYYIRAYATNNNGTGYSPIVTSFKICPATFVVTHVAGLNGAPISKTVTYHSVTSDWSGSARCWLTQNLGADRQPTAIADATELSSGWYWQFNSSQGYMNDGSTLTPSITAWTPWTGVADNYNWRPERDPCNLLLGLGWRLPTSTEWSNVINNGHWAYLNPYNSPLKIHRAGFLDGGGFGAAKGAAGYYCSSTQNGSGSDFEFYYDGATGSMTSNGKVRYAWSVRCLRDTLVLTTPSVTNATISTSTMTLTTVDATATVGSDGGLTVKERGFCWNTTGNPTIGDNKMTISSGLGTFNGTIPNLKEGPTYYLRAYAINDNGTGYSPIVTSFKICPATFAVTHVAGLNGAPVGKTVTYHSVTSDWSGSARCWLTQNLGADQQPTAISDASELSSGWYWQFNSSQGYKNDGSTLTPSITAWTPWTGVADNYNWRPERDPCNLLLGLGWRLPTSTEWSNVINNGHWAYLNPFASPLKIHRAGYLDGGGLAGAKGSVGYYCSSTQNGSGSDFEFLLSGATGSMTSNGKVRYAWSVRCLRDTLVMTTPSVSDAVIPTSTMTLTTADATATTVGLTAGPSISESGFCWNTTGNPTVDDNKMAIGTGFETFSGTISNLVEGTTYYVRAYARNSIGVGYSSNVTSFKICPATFSVTHVAGINGAPVSKTVTYHSVSSNFSGVSRCWLTQNLGADQQPTSISDATELSSGWYWQFNSAKGYKNDGSTLTPSLATLPWSGFTENSDWRSTNDPCSLLLGAAWRLPTYSEWANVINNGHFAYLNPYASPLMMHRAGYLDGGGLAGAKGSVGYYCSSTQNGSGSDFEFLLSGTTGSMVSNGKARYAWSVRCLRN